MYRDYAPAKDRRQADPDQDDEFVDPVDLEDPAAPKIPPFQVRVLLGHQPAAVLCLRGIAAMMLVFTDFNHEEAKG